MRSQERDSRIVARFARGCASPVLKCRHMSMETPHDAPHPKIRQIPEILDLSNRADYEEITVGDLELLRNEINFKLAMLLNLQLKVLHNGIDHTRAAMTPEEELQMAREIGSGNFADFVKWRQSQTRPTATEQPSLKRRPDVGW